jgi:hypothetical protein
MICPIQIPSQNLTLNKTIPHQANSLQTKFSISSLSKTTKNYNKKINITIKTANLHLQMLPKKQKKPNLSFSISKIIVCEKLRKNAFPKF